MNTLKVTTVTAGLALTAGLGVAALTAPAAQATQPAQKAPRSCVGTWETSIVIDPAAPPARALASFFADGNVIISQQGALRSNVPGGADVEFNSAGHGAWKPAGTRSTCAFTVKVYSADVTGADTGGATIRGSLSVTGTGNTVAGKAEFTTFLPDGGGFGPTPITVTGTRIQP